MLSAVVVFVGERLAFAVPAFAAVNVGLALVWFFIVSQLGSENKRRMASASAD